MSMTESLSREPSTYGGFADALGGIATIVLAIVGLAGVHPQLLISIGNHRLWCGPADRGRDDVNRIRPGCLSIRRA